MTSAPDPASPTEARSAIARDLDTQDSAALVALFVREGRAAADAALLAAPAIAVAVDAIVPRLAAGGRLYYAGAGTSGRLAVLDAAECPPTFGTPPSLVVALVAGGRDALERAVEGAEDDARAGTAAAGAVRDGDALVGISAGGGAAFVVAAVREARARGALTVALTSAAGSPLAAAADVRIVVETGAEPIAGSTRMKAGTAQKIVLNALSTATMVRLGHAYDNLMVDVAPTNAKLRARALGLVMTLANADAARARELLAAANGSVKVAVVMHRRGVDAARARALLDAAHGFLRPVIEAR